MKSRKINIAIAISLVLSVLALSVALFVVTLNRQCPLDCRIFTSITQLPGWLCLTLIFGEELKNEMQSK